MTLVDRVLPKGILQKYQKKELKGNYNFTEGEYHLANYLDKYAQTGKEYTDVLTKIILQNSLVDFDDAKLLPTSEKLKKII